MKAVTIALVALVAMLLPATPAPAAGATEHFVDVSDFEFRDAASDSSITEAAVGDTVTFRFVGGIHTATHGAFGPLDGVAGGAFDTGTRSSGTVTVTLDEAGTFPYYCKLHPTMRGVILVE